MLLRSGWGTGFYRGAATRASRAPGSVAPAGTATLPAMPVLVTGAEHAVGRAALRVLLRAGGEVRAYLDPHAVRDGLVGELRAAGCKVARGTPDDEGLLELALEQVHTVVHAGADPLVSAEAVLDDAASVLSAALGAGCRRLIVVSHLGVGEPRGNPWLEALAEVEEMLVDAPLETVVIRRTLTYGPDDALTAVLAQSSAGAAPDAQHEPVWIEDLAAALVAADARDRSGALPHLQVDLRGPQLTSLAEFVALLGGQVVGGLRHRIQSPGAGAPVPPHVVELLSRDLVLDREAPSAGTTLGAGAKRVRAELHDD